MGVDPNNYDILNFPAYRKMIEENNERRSRLVKELGENIPACLK